MPTVTAISVSVGSDTLSVDLDDGRTITVPLAWFPRLLHATDGERAQWRLIGRGSGIQWPLVEEDLSVASLLQGRRSAESASSLQSWLAARGSNAGKP